MPEPLDELEAERDRLYAQLSAVGDFRRGSVSENYRRCGKPNCACAQPDHPGHGPRFLWTRSEGGAEEESAGSWPPAEVEKVRRESWTRYAEFAAAERADRGGQREDLRGPAGRPATDAPPRRRAKKGAPRRARGGGVRRDRAAGGGGGPGAGLRRRGLEAAEAVIRAGMLQLGGGMLGQLLAADPGYRGPRVPVRPGARGGIRRLPGQDHRHRPRPGHASPCLVPLRGMQARLRAPRRRARRGRARRCRPGWPR